MSRSPPAVAGPGPSTEANRRLGDLDAEGEDDPDAMQGVEEAVRDIVNGRGQSEEEDELQGEVPTWPRPMLKRDPVPNPSASAKVKGKQRAVEPIREAVPNPSPSAKRKQAAPETEPESEDSSDDSSWRNKVIVSRPKALNRPPPKQRYPVRGRPSGKLFLTPCQNCVKGNIDCEVDLKGGACVGCKRKKQGCPYAPRRATSKKVKSKAKIESEDEDTDRPISTAPLNVSIPPIATLTSASPPRPTPGKRAPQPTARLPTRAPPLREARTRATQAIQEAAGGQLASPPTVEPRPVRRRSPSGSRTQKPNAGAFFVPVNSTIWQSLTFVDSPIQQ
jgi:hypothetical protein